MAQSFSLSLGAFVFATVTLVFSTEAHALPQYKRLVQKEYNFKAPCSTCHSEGGGSSLSAYGKAFERGGKSQRAIQLIAAQVPPGDKLSFGAKLKAKANPNDPKSTPENPGDWAGGSGIPTEELKSFSPPDITGFSILEGELKADQITKLKEKLGDAFQEEDRFPTFYFGEVKGKKTYVIQYVRSAKIKKTIGLVVSTAGKVKNLAFVGKEKGEVPAAVREKFIEKSLAEIEKTPASGEGEYPEIRNSVLRGLNAINLVFGKQ